MEAGPSDRGMTDICDGLVPTTAVAFQLTTFTPFQTPEADDG
jgi:hypothetical protein